MRKVWVTNSGNLRRERIYLGGFEVWRRYDKVGGNWVLDDERETVHISDDARRICMAETLTWESGSAPGTITPRYRFQLDNHLGTACVEVDETGAVISYEEYHPYGTSSYRSWKTGVEVSAKRYRYTGKERDEETGLSYHGARYYAPWLGRWMSADPAGTVDGTNLFAYVRGSPVVMSDPSGMSGMTGSSFNRRKRVVWGKPQGQGVTGAAKPKATGFDSVEAPPGERAAAAVRDFANRGPTPIKTTADAAGQEAGKEVAARLVGLLTLISKTGFGVFMSPGLSEAPPTVDEQTELIGEVLAGVGDYAASIPSDGATAVVGDPADPQHGRTRAGVRLGIKAIEIGLLFRALRPAGEGGLLDDVPVEITPENVTELGLGSFERLIPASGRRTPVQAKMSPTDAARIQRVADVTGQRITVVGSRASGETNAASDWDYIVSGANSRIRGKAKNRLPRGHRGGEGNSGIDFWQDVNPKAKQTYVPLDPERPHVIFEPQKR